MSAPVFLEKHVSGETPLPPTRRDGARWTEWEDLQLAMRAAVDDETFEVLADRIGRSAAACRKRAFLIGATTPNATTRDRLNPIERGPQP